MDGLNPSGDLENVVIKCKNVKEKSVTYDPAS